MYRSIRTGEIAEFSGISSPYEAHHVPELTFPTGVLTLDESVESVLYFSEQRGVISVERNPD
jgi:adenylylsulfate kinase